MPNNLKTLKICQAALSPGFVPQKVLVLCLLFAFVNSSLFARTLLVLPWAADNQTFATTLVINNFNETEVTILLTAARAGEGTLDSYEYVLAPFESMTGSSSDMIPNAGRGFGYAIYLSSRSDNISMSAIIASKTTASGNSPSQVNAIPWDSATRVLNFGSLPVNDESYSAPVIVSIDRRPNFVNIWAFKDGKLARFRQNGIEPLQPLVLSTSEIFPGLEGEYRVVIKSHSPLIGVSFLFNQQLEPALMEATTLPDRYQPDREYSP